MRPKQPHFTDHTDSNSYYNLNRYYNEAEKTFDKLEKLVKHIPMDEFPCNCVIRLVDCGCPPLEKIIKETRVILGVVTKERGEDE